MKTKICALITAALCFAAPHALASTYIGTWKNTTFSTSGSLKMQFTITKTNVTGSLDLDGPVFGAGDPPAIPFNMKRKPDGSGSFKINGTPLGDIAVSYKPDGALDMDITNVPGTIIDDASFNGRFDLKLEKFAAVYEINANGSVLAEGVAEAHVRKAPTIKAPKTVKVSGKSGGVKAKVITNTGIKSFTAKANAGAKATVTGNNPYQITVTKITKPNTRVTLVATNTDGLKKTKVVKFVLNNPKALLLE
jgi:hypothetical protein